MNTIQKALIVCAMVSVSGFAAGDEYDPEEESYAAASLAISGRKGCSLADVVGRWVFATAIGRQMAPMFPADKDLTALGTMLIKRDGTLSGTFDLTVEEFDHFSGIGYDGLIQINRDCTGTLTFVNEFGATRTDSIAVVGRSEILAMSQDPANLWTYEIRRVGSPNPRRR